MKELSESFKWFKEQKPLHPPDTEPRMDKLMETLRADVAFVKDVFVAKTCESKRVLVAPEQAGKDALQSLYRSCEAVLQEATTQNNATFLIAEMYNMRLKDGSSGSLAEAEDLLAKYDRLAEGYQNICERYKVTVKAQDVMIDSLMSELKVKIKENKQIKETIDRISEKVDNIETHVRPTFKAVNIVNERGGSDNEKGTPYDAKN